MAGVIQNMFGMLDDESCKEFMSFVMPIMTPIVTSFVNTGDLAVTLTEDSGSIRQLEGEEATRLLVTGLTGYQNTKPTEDSNITDDGYDDLD
ncbi:unnamed protein product [marine sediment metagenome]|uniref:Uncharacterized protein n=1 Tax=marine sediment metagenome TaxID=412755 RepID=X0TKC4_9ZZZZ